MSLSTVYKPKLAFFVSRFPFPLEKGDKLRAYYQLRDLQKHFDIYLFCISDKSVNDENFKIISSLCTEIHVFELKKPLLYFNLLKNIFSRKPFQVAYFKQNWIQRKVNEKLKEINADKIYCQLIRTTEYVKNNHNCSKTLDIMDALSKGMERRAEGASRFIAWVYREEASRLKQYESKIIDYFENFSIISDQDKKFIIHPKNKKIQLIPNGVSENFVSSKNEVIKQYDLIFTGNMNYPPNVEASLFIIEQLYPKLRQSFPYLKIGIVGTNPHSSVKKHNSEEIIVTGWVENIVEEYQKAVIFIAPMFSGTGMQNKILEAMAVGIPCITTTLANNAILAKDGESILIADEIMEMVFFIQKLKNDSEFYQKISENAQKFVQENCNWKQINQKLIDLIES